MYSQLAKFQCFFDSLEKFFGKDWVESFNGDYFCKKIR
jgi:hypothetical protein